MDLSYFKRVYPFKSNYMKIGKHTIHYVDEGEGAPIVMVHGNPTWSFYFRNIIKELSKDFRCIAIDHVGCGLSDKPSPEEYSYLLKDRVKDFDQFLNKLEIKEKLSIIMHDWGGAIALHYAGLNSEKIDKLVITNTSCFPLTSNFLFKKIPLRLWLLKKFAKISKFLILNLNLFSNAASYMAVKKKFNKKDKELLNAPYDCKKNRVAVYKFVQDIPLEPRDESYKLLKEIEKNLINIKKIPILLLWGKNDFVFTENYFKEWQKRFPFAMSHLFKKAGHYLFEDEKELCLKMINNFLKKK